MYSFNFYVIVLANKSPDLNVILLISSTNKVAMATAGLLKYSNKTIAEQEYPGC